ncbi:hypothetical protein SpCBS45565_g06546 [Spizellomyces sp. 'palustris']|nr:hypothetical protein SpCBS45565_g06546 [Spizellomyces sp. 'palustris']
MSDYEDFRASVLTAIQQIPKGRVTSYGHIAKLVDHPRHARYVGRVLRSLNREEGLRTPWQRVVNHRGRISPRVPSDSCGTQAEILRQEGVVVEVDSMGLFFVDLHSYGWFPNSISIPIAHPQ